MKIAVIGLGYVGLPLLLELSNKFDVIGFDIDSRRIETLIDGIDLTGENQNKVTQLAGFSTFTQNSSNLRGVDVFIVTVPTPVHDSKQPDLRSLIAATETCARNLSWGGLVIYESTVYPGATEDVCIPILEKISGLGVNSDFGVGYSPERINPGDKSHTIQNITKIISASSDYWLSKVEKVYSSIINAGLFSASSIIVAETAKAIENTQRDVNIALINELSTICLGLGISVWDVLEAASTKWNFISYQPGLVGGHCIGVDPYYLAFAANKLGIFPDLILAGRRTNKTMPKKIAELVVKKMIGKGVDLRGAPLLLAGLAFKENCSDIRNSLVYDLYCELVSWGVHPLIYDPWVSHQEVTSHYGGVNFISDLTSEDKFRAVILAVRHDSFRKIGADGWRAYCQEDDDVIFDLKNMFMGHDGFDRL